MAPCFLSVSFFKWLVTFAPFQSVETILESIEFWRMTSTSTISVTMLFKTSKCHWFQRISDLSFASISPWLVCTKTNILCSLFIPNSCTPKNCEVKHKIFYACVIFSTQCFLPQSQKGNSKPANLPSYIFTEVLATCICVSSEAIHSFCFFFHINVLALLYWNLKLFH